MSGKIAMASRISTVGVMKSQASWRSVSGGRGRGTGIRPPCCLVVSVGTTLAPLLVSPMPRASGRAAARTEAFNPPPPFLRARDGLLAAQDGLVPAGDRVQGLLGADLPCVGLVDRLSQDRE